MSYKEKSLHCVSCKKDFIFTVEQQEALVSKGYPNEPLRCPPCLRARKNTNNRSSEDSTPNTTRSGGYLR